MPSPLSPLSPSANALAINAFRPNVTLEVKLEVKACPLGLQSTTALSKPSG